MTGSFDIRKTGDGSHTLFHRELDESYHSLYGAVEESKHVFIDAGLAYFPQEVPELNVLEVGYGTGLNALLSYIWAQQYKRKVKYYGIEAFPPDRELINHLNHARILDVDNIVYQNFHPDPATLKKIGSHFTLQVENLSIHKVELSDNAFQVVFFDAFSPVKQPEMWTAELFRKIHTSMVRGGVLTTYSSSGLVKRALRSAGFKVKRLPGPPGKHEMLRATKV
ncbi:MAG: tRNA (5-methylaminomethyl-2-thiouridine)(34)-methyltransferase MnmD [bacterium]